jgi:mannitol-1-phosphate/altronate dehydrogenase
MPQHIIIGPGKLGLGFSGDLFARSGGLSTSIISRTAKTKSSPISSVVRDERIKQDRSYRVNYGDREKTVSNIKLLSCNYADPSEEVLSEFTDIDLKLITVTVPDAGLHDVSLLLARCLEARIRKIPHQKLPLVLTFVNMFNNGQIMLGGILRNCSENLQNFIKNTSNFTPNCVIDRICSRVDTTGPSVTVHVESYANLIINRSEDIEIIRDVASKWNKEFGLSILKEVDDLVPWELLKFWGLNGLHLLLAAITRTPVYEKNAKGKTDIRIAQVAADPKVRALMEGFISEVSLAIRSKHPSSISREDARHFLDSTVTRLLKDASDTDSRLLQSLRLDTNSVTHLLTTTDIRLGDKSSIEQLARTIVHDSVGEFLGKVEVRLLAPTFHLCGTERVYPINLAIGTSCALYAMAKYLKENACQLD